MGKEVPAASRCSMTMAAKGRTGREVKHTFPLGQLLLHQYQVWVLQVASFLRQNPVYTRECRTLHLRLQLRQQTV